MAFSALASKTINSKLNKAIKKEMNIVNFVFIFLINTTLAQKSIHSINRIMLTFFYDYKNY